MSATIGNFYERVSRAIRRGTVYDDDIPGYAADAVRELEDLENWKYMSKEVDGTMAIGSAILSLVGSPKLKSVRFIHVRDEDEEELPLTKTQRENVEIIADGRPGAYWMVDRDTIKMDAKPDIAYKFTIGYFEYSPTPLVSALAWLTFGEDLLIARTINKMQPIIRDDKLKVRWGAIEATRMPSLLESEIVSEYDGQDNSTVPFTSEVNEDRSDQGTFR